MLQTEETPKSRTCRVCNGPLTGLTRKYCSKKCHYKYAYRGRKHYYRMFGVVNSCSRGYAPNLDNYNPKDIRLFFEICKVAGSRKKSHGPI